MSYIFRKHSGRNQNLKNWENSTIIDNDSILTIPSAISNTAQSKIATSIPTPFARVYLFKAAFEAYKTASENGTPLSAMNKKLISDCLDIFQLLFDAGNDSSRIRFVKWDRNVRISKLQSTNQPKGHQLLGRSLELCFNDESAFLGWNELYFIFYDNKLLGGTCPFTLFFTAPSWEREMKQAGIVIRSAGEDIYFDDIPCLLPQRDPDFQEFMLRFSKVFGTQLEEIAAPLNLYIQSSIEKENKALFERVIHQSHQLTLDVFEQGFPKISISDNELLFVKGVPIYTRKPEDIDSAIEAYSQFKIQATVNHYQSVQSFKEAYTNRNTYPSPLVLQKGNFPLRYVGDLWNPNIEVNDIPHIPVERRSLPGLTNINYPYLTVGDFLHENLINVEDNINDEAFFSGLKTGDFPFLLPIKREYFNYFTIHDLKNNLQITYNTPATPGASFSVEVKLKIPIQSANLQFPNITLSKTYYSTPTNNNHQGKIQKARFGLAIFPFYRVMEDSLNQYSVMAIPADKNHPLKTRFWKSEQIHTSISIESNLELRRYGRSDTGFTHFHSIKGQSFDLIEVDFGNQIGSGLIIPNWTKTAETNEPMYFGIDFGTSNTHIAWASKGKQVQNFTINEEDMQMVTLAKRNKEFKGANSYSNTLTFGEFKTAQRRQFMPYLIGPYEQMPKYPMRTATCETLSFVNQSSVNLFSQINIGFGVESEGNKAESDKYLTNIKWGFETDRADVSARNRVEASFKQMLWMVKNKILLNGGSLRDSKIVWFIPLSMNRGTRGIFEELWKKAAIEIFGKTEILSQLSESVAPYLAIVNETQAYTEQNLINIDIGGGTTDIYFYIKNPSNRRVSLSLRFAANDIWGDGLVRASKANGFCSYIMKKVERDEIAIPADLKSTWSTFSGYDELDSSDLIAFLFKHEDQFRLGQKISATPIFLTPLVVHFGAILYHITSFLHKENLPCPQYLTFTGKGSEYIRLISPSSSNILDLCTLLLRKFHPEPDFEIPRQFTVGLIDGPKEITAKGGVITLQKTEEKQNTQPENSSFLGAGIQDPLLIGHLMTAQEPMLKEYERFLTILFEDPEVAKMARSLNISLFSPKEDIKSFFLEEGKLSYQEYQGKRLNSQPDQTEELEESPFFWPLKNAIFKFTQKMQTL